jgi:hypothetical protein
MDKPRDDPAVLAALRQRFPKPRGAAAVFQFASIVASNTYLLFLVVTAQASPASLVAFNVIELILLSVIAHLVLLGVPALARMPGAESGNIASRIFVLIFIAGWLYAVYSFSLMIDRKNLEVLAQTPGIWAKLQAMHITVPLLLSASLAIVGTVGDWLTWRRRGGMFIPQMAMSGGPKILTLVFAPIVSAMCGFAFVDGHPEFALIAWSAIYLLVKALSELGMLAWQYFGMPEAKPTAKSSA